MIMAFPRAVLLILAVFIAVSDSRIPKYDDSSSSEEEHTSVENSEVDFISELRSMCLKRTGSNDTFDPLMTAVQNGAMCFAKKLDVDEFFGHAENLTSANRVQFFTTYCPQMREAISCLSPAAIVIRKCLNEDGQELLDILMSVLPRAVDLTCKNHGEIFFNDVNLSKCFDNINEYIGNCMSGGFSQLTLGAMSINSKRKQCEDLALMRRCLATRLNNCKSPRLIDFFDLLYRPLIRSSECKHLWATKIVRM
ncbi:uncharacterized protein LOC129765171 [Toxorhynchites rutilus septentrionalis]|uniref:uncharacterized protein LOC129765171 n=1 Tax=Toxorhynchites rutilus septentrionalis TaxID=329112 RepID=UPI002479EDA2|nr:uncharacterized protein LOC129765171 [Toxorhynchites rutilus septentrionalis]